MRIKTHLGNVLYLRSVQSQYQSQLYHCLKAPSDISIIFYYRQHVVQWRRILPQLYGWKAAPGLGTVATVYNRTNLREIVSSLRRSPRAGPLDLQISKYRRDSGLAGFLLEPNLVRHIGSQSSRYQVRTGDTRDRVVHLDVEE